MNTKRQELAHGAERLLEGLGRTDAMRSSPVVRREECAGRQVTVRCRSCGNKESLAIAPNAVPYALAP